MRYEARSPRAELEPFVKCLWRLRGAPSEIEPQPIVPDGCFELIVHLGEPFVEQGVYAPEGRGRAGWPVKQHRALLAATLTRTVVVAASGDVDVVGVRFRPGRAYPFLSAAPSEVVDIVAPATDVCTSDLAAWTKRLEPASTELVFASAEEALLARLRRVGSDPRFDRIATTLVAADGAPVASLAEAAGISQRQFERWFKSRAGVSAKVLQRVVRFHRVAMRLLEGSPDLATLALDTGFFDQAHMSHEFRALADVSPSRYLAHAGALDRLFAES
jgi:AraC-like DNA-binding protein